MASFAPAEKGPWWRWPKQRPKTPPPEVERGEDAGPPAERPELEAAVPKSGEFLARALWSAAHRVVAPRTLLGHLKAHHPAFRECVTHFDVRGASTRIAVTVDDAPSDAALMAAALDALATAGVKATFFVVASFARDAERRATLARAVGEGHELGNHLVEDASSSLLTPAEFEEALRECDSLIASIDASWPTKRYKWFRPPRGYMASWMREPLARLGYAPVLADVFPLDTEVRSVDYLVNFCVENARPGSILLLHAPDVRTGGDGRVHQRQNNVDVFARLFPRLLERCKLGTLSDLAAESAALVALDESLEAARTEGDAAPPEADGPGGEPPAA